MNSERVLPQPCGPGVVISAFAQTAGADDGVHWLVTVPPEGSGHPMDLGLMVEMNGVLAGRRALVTGASRGIGAAMAADGDGSIVNGGLPGLGRGRHDHGAEVPLDGGFTFA